MVVTLAMDTSSRSMSVALLRDEELLAEFYLDAGRRHEESLVPAVEHVLDRAGRAMDNVDLFACSVGPGSFTGLRVGLATAKGFAGALRKPLVGVSSLEALALNVMYSERAVCPMLDARRGEVYAAVYDGLGPDGLPREIVREQVSEPASFLEQIEGHLLFVGDGSEVYKEVIRDILGERAHFAGSAADRIRASVIGRIGLKKRDADDTGDIYALTPRYLRPSYVGL